MPRASCPASSPTASCRCSKANGSDAEIVIVINASDIEKNKIRARPRHHLRRATCCASSTCSVAIGLYRRQRCHRRSIPVSPPRLASRNRLENARRAGLSATIPSRVILTTSRTIVSDEGYGKNEYIETEPPAGCRNRARPRKRQRWRPAFPSSTTNNRRGIKAGYAKFETFPIWNLPLKHPVNLAYEAATADLNDVNMIDPYHLEAYGETTVNYNRDVEVFPVLNAMFEKIDGQDPLINRPPIWASTWRATASPTTPRPATPL